MQGRRGLRWGQGLAAVLLLVSPAGAGAEQPSPDAALARLKAGSAHATPTAPDAGGADAVGPAGTPLAAVLSCAESAQSAERVFGARSGELFVVRTLGHVTDRATLASLEYAVEQLHVPLIVVLGHEFCGALRVAIEAPPGHSLGPNYEFLLKALRPSARQAAGEGRLRRAVLENVEESINVLLAESAVIRRSAEDKRVRLVGAFHEAGAGRVYFSGLVEVPRFVAAAAEPH